MKKLSMTSLSTAIPSASTNYDTAACDFVAAVACQVVWASSTASFAYQLKGSNDGTNWVNIGSSQAIANDSGTTLTQLKWFYDFRYYRVALTKTSGTLTAWSVGFSFEPR